MANPERKQFMVFVRFSAPLRRNATLRILAGPVCLGPVNRLSIYSAAFEGSTRFTAPISYQARRESLQLFWTSKS